MKIYNYIKGISMPVNNAEMQRFINLYGTSEQKEQLKILVEQIKDIRHTGAIATSQSIAGIKATMLLEAADIFSKNLFSYTLNPWAKVLFTFAFSYGAQELAARISNPPAQPIVFLHADIILEPTNAAQVIEQIFT